MVNTYQPPARRETPGRRRIVCRSRRLRRSRRRARRGDIRLAWQQVDVVLNHLEATGCRRQPGDSVHPDHPTAPRQQRQGTEMPARAAGSAAGTPPVPGPISDAGQEGEHEAERLLNRRVVRSGTPARYRDLATRRLTTSGCGWRSWLTARRRWRSTTLRPLAAAPPAGLGPTRRPRLLQPLRRPRRHHSKRPPGFVSRPRQRS